MIFNKLYLRRKPDIFVPRRVPTSGAELKEKSTGARASVPLAPLRKFAVHWLAANLERRS